MKYFGALHRQMSISALRLLCRPGFVCYLAKWLLLQHEMLFLSVVWHCSNTKCCFLVSCGILFSDLVMLYSIESFCFCIICCFLRQIIPIASYWLVSFCAQFNIAVLCFISMYFGLVFCCVIML